MQYHLTTDGEKLVAYLHRQLLYDVPWTEISEALFVTGRGPLLTDYFREATIVNFGCRIIKAGTSLLKECRERNNESLFEEAFRESLRRNYSISSDILEGILRMASQAATISSRIPNQLRRALEQRAVRERATCYMCGQDLNFEERGQYNSLTLEHIWPNDYGGNSIEENLLPSCQSCNSDKKGNFASWGMVGIQALILGLHPSEDERTSGVSGTFRFALHHYAARKLAARDHLTLKAAFIQLGPWTNIRVYDYDDVGDFFNLYNHDPIVIME